MAILITLQGPDVGKRYSLDSPTSVLGRQFDSTICLTAKAVSRQHAQIVFRNGEVLVEDLDSSNGTFVNGVRLAPHDLTPLTESDSLQIGPYVFGLRRKAPAASTEPTMYVREEVSAAPLGQELFSQDSATKLQVVLEIAQNLARTLEVEPLLLKLIEQLMQLFPQADRALVIFCEGDELVVRAQQARGRSSQSKIPFSRTVVRKALVEGIGILSDDAQTDQRFEESQTLTQIDIHSVLCVPLINQQGKAIGVLQMDRFRPGIGFRIEDLQLLTVVSLQVTVALENAALHAERLVEERFHHELEMAHEIQEGFLPNHGAVTEAAGEQHQEEFPGTGLAIYGQVFPARVVAGDLYDYFLLPDGRLAFFIGDVSGKGMPAALFMVAVHTLCRHLAKEPGTTGQILSRLNDSLVADNPNCMFVTLLHGTYSPQTGEVLLSSAGHPAPFLRRASGNVERVSLPSGRLLGYADGQPVWTEIRLNLSPGDLLTFFTDGLFESRSPVEKEHFGFARIEELVRDFTADRTLADCAESAKTSLETFTSSKDLQDDLTLLLLRRNS